MTDEELNEALQVISRKLVTEANGLCLPLAMQTSPEVISVSLACACATALTIFSRANARMVLAKFMTQQDADAISRQAVISCAKTLMETCRSQGINVVFIDNGDTPATHTRQ